MSLLSFAIALWGLQTELWVFAIPMILVFEGRRFVQRRWSFSLNDLKRLFKLCIGLLGLLFIFLFITQQSFSLIYRLLQWLPICTFPLIAAEAYSARGLSFLLSILFSDPYLLRNGFNWKQKPIELYTPYFALCLFSASATNTNGFFFSIMTATLVALVLRNYRPKRSPLIVWVCLILLASGMGFLGQIQLHQLQSKLEQQTAPWLSGLSGDSVDPYQANTRMGSIEDLKQSNAIVFRVTGDRPSFPILLREATYNKYGSASWIATQSKFAPVPPNPDGKTWSLGTVTTSSPPITVSSNLNNGKGVLRLPSGTLAIAHLPVEQMKKNQYGTVKIEGAQGAVSYQIQFNPNQSGDSLPTVDDLQIPDSERSSVQQTLKAINIKGKSNPEVLDQVSAYFEKNFRYSLRRSQFNQSATPLSTFLLKSHSGHCEYFASATTLLLREAGIPARYAVGYSVDEFSPLEGQYIVRSRDAHAWVMAYVDGNWRSFDTTPSSWGAQEDASASPLQAISDLWAFVGFKLASGGVWVYGGAIGAITTFFLWKWSRKFRVRRSTVPAILEAEPLPPLIQTGLDSEFYLIEKRLDELSLKRISSESLQEWIIRLSVQMSESQFEPLKAIIMLHNRYRFDPQGIEAKEREKLKFLSQAWLEKFDLVNGTRSK
jgi:protein-glutamine gamma-glutamyltransferase